jgi:pimeloyl-ACP methyl ester carboxylesterase
VRKALNLSKDNLYLLVQSWGGILAMEYALKYQDNLKGLIISNMMATPLPIFHDIVENTNVKGSVIIGVAPPLTFEHAPLWSRASSLSEFHKNRTYAQCLNYSLSIPIQNCLAFVSNDDQAWFDDINLKAMLKTIQLPSRTEKLSEPPFIPN